MDESDDPKKGRAGPRPVGDSTILRDLARESRRRSAVLTPIQERIVEGAINLQDSDAVLFQHSVLCQTCLPYRDPGDEVREWERVNGRVSLAVTAGKVLDPNTGKFIKVGLPFGPKPRLMLYALNAEALRTQSPQIELEKTFTGFVRRTLGLHTDGRTLEAVKNQITRLASADFRFGTIIDGRAVMVKDPVIRGFDLWYEKEPSQKVLWPSVVQFSREYFESLMKHAVPLNETAIARLSHSAMGLDIYTWLAQRLHRIDEGKAPLVPWVSLWEQFGQGYGVIRKFRQVFVATLRQVKAVYPEAKFHLTQQGMILEQSRSAVARRLLPL